MESREASMTIEHQGRRNDQPAPSANGSNGPTPEPPASGATGQNGRTAGGQFAQGNLGGPGNPYARRVAALRKVLLEVVDADQMRRIITRLVRVAEGGNLAAAKLILSYTLGKPADVVDPDRLDLEEAAGT
jgi:hypothetical protein